MTGIPKEAGAWQLATKLKNGWGSVQNYFKGSKALPAPAVPNAPKAWGTGPKNTPITNPQFGAFTPKPQPAPPPQPGWFGRASEFGDKALDNLNKITAPLFVYGMARDMFSGGGGQVQEPAMTPEQHAQLQAQMQMSTGQYGQQPGYYGGYDPRNEPMQGNIGDWFRGVFTRGRNPALEQQYQQQAAEINQRAAQMAGRG